MNTNTVRRHRARALRVLAASVIALPVVAVPAATAATLTSGAGLSIAAGPLDTCAHSDSSGSAVIDKLPC
jgi:uncharacterized protein YraI